MNAKRFLRVPFVSLRGPPSSFQNSPACVLFGAATASVCLFTAGPSLDLFLGTLLLSAIIAPALAGDLTSTTPGSEACPVFDPEAQTRREPVERVLRRPGSFWQETSPTRIAPLVAGCSLVWLGAVIDGPVTVLQWIECTLVLASFIAAMICAARLLQRCRIHPAAASAIVTFSSLAWLTWPIWMGDSGPIAIHPVFAINAACKELGIWTEQRIAYRLINLGQDTPYRLPGSVLPAVLFHMALAGIFILLNPGYSRPRHKGTKESGKGTADSADSADEE